jgi:hypothetical protein
LRLQTPSNDFGASNYRRDSNTGGGGGGSTSHKNQTAGSTAIDFFLKQGSTSNAVHHANTTGKVSSPNHASSQLKSTTANHNRYCSTGAALA